MAAVLPGNSARRAAPQLAVVTPSEGQSVSGLLPLVLDIVDPRGASTQGMRLRLGFPDSRQADAVRELRPGEPSGRHTVVLHTHLLPNGRNRVELIVEDDKGAPLCAHGITLHVANEGRVAADVRRSLRQSGVPLVLEGPCDAACYDYGDDSLTPWFDRPDALQTVGGWLASGRVTADEAGALRHFVTEGYMVVPDLIEDELIARINREIDHAVEAKYQGYEHGSSMRLEHLHYHYPGIRRLWLHEGVMRWLGLVFDGPVGVCQTLTYVFGSQQDAHQDTVHLTPFPAGYMCGVWTALEDVRPGSGELEIYPRSHRLARVYMRQAGCAKVAGKDWSGFTATVVAHWRRMIEEHRLEKHVYRAKAGDVPIWHENLMHAGGRRLDMSLSRRSIVTHNFAAGALAFYDSTGLPGYNRGRATVTD